MAWSIPLLGLQVLVFAFLLAGSFGLVQRYGLQTVSFVGFYGAGQLAAEDHPHLAYDEMILYENEVGLVQRGIFYTPFLYPPIYLLLCATLSIWTIGYVRHALQAAVRPTYPGCPHCRQAMERDHRSRRRGRTSCRPFHRSVRLAT
jgi:hypothetical protein